MPKPRLKQWNQLRLWRFIDSLRHLPDTTPLSASAMIRRENFAEWKCMHTTAAADDRFYLVTVMHNPARVPEHRTERGL